MKIYPEGADLIWMERQTWGK